MVESRLAELRNQAAASRARLSHWALIWLILFLFSITCLTLVFGAESGQFLNIGIGARPVATGYSVSTIIDDLNALTYNPAGLSRMKTQEASFTHAQLFDESTRLDFLGYAHPLSLAGMPSTVAGAVTYMSQGAIAGRDASRQPTGNITASDTSLQLGMGMQMTDSIGLGAGVRYIESQLAAANARTMAFDFGGQFRLGNAQFGAAMRNIGPGLRYLDSADSLPLMASLGAGYYLPMVGLLISANLSRHLYTGKSEFSLGSEYVLLPTLALRAGYLANLAEGTSALSPTTGGSNMGSLGTGLGLKIMGSQLDYAFTPMGELGATHRLSLSSRF